MVRGLNSSTESELEWLSEFAKGMSIQWSIYHIDHANRPLSDFRRRFLTLLSYNFREFGSVTALSVIEAANAGAKSADQGQSARGQPLMIPQVLLQIHASQTLAPQS